MRWARFEQNGKPTYGVVVLFFVLLMFNAGQQKPLLPGHVPQCFFLNRLRFRSCIRHHHGVMVACAGKGFGYAYAGETLGPRR